MPVEVTMPQLSDTMSEGTLVKWLKKEGDKVKAGEAIAEVETDKATMEMESFEGGTVAYQALKEGEKASVGGLIAVLASGSENPADVKKQYASGAAKPKVAAPAATASQAPATADKARPVPVAKAATSAGAPAGGKVSATHDATTATLEAASSGEIHDLGDNLHGATREDINTDPRAKEGGNGRGNRLRVSPVARRIAEDAGIELNQIRGSGPGGRVVQADVVAFQDKGGAARAAALSAAPSAERAPLPAPRITGQTQVIPMSKMRSAIAAALKNSKQNVPHFYATVDIDLEEVNKLRQSMNVRLEKEKIRLSIADFLAKAVAYSLTLHPILNARFNAEKNEVTRYTDVNLGTAVSVPDGLIVPILRGVDRMGLKEIRQRSADLIERARAQRLRREEQTEGTFTISSLGSLGIRGFSAIINPPEVAILAVGAAEKRAVVRGDQIVARTLMTVTLSLDHRIVDGAVAAEFLQTLKATLEEPASMLL